MGSKMGWFIFCIVDISQKGRGEKIFARKLKNFVEKFRERDRRDKNKSSQENKKGGGKRNLSSSENRDKSENRSWNDCDGNFFFVLKC
jgi:hypothetical protein